jgi:hypothetical protein
MTLLLDPARIPDRRAIAAGALAPLAQSLSDDLRPVITRDLFVPDEKARLTRDGGRCPDDGTLLEFDPFSPRRHRCARCGRSFAEEAHYRWWIMSYQLWLAERAVHGALLGLLRADAEAAAFSERILEEYVARYLQYPNTDNVLGPSRLFFSTYLESIWLLQICLAIDLLEASRRAERLGQRVREQIVEPASEIIRAYDEGSSNRQVWNNAALLAATAVLGATPSLEPLVWGPSGLISHLARGLLADGTWYEGENYHLFAHRGLWYGVQLAERLDLGMSEPFSAPFVKRFDEGFAASFVTALPDLTLPARRDSQYAISVRQWRFAELCELGLARRGDPRLGGMLTRLYGDDVPRRETGRAVSTAEVERNLPPTKLGRADLGWRSLLLAQAILPVVRPEPARSVLLDGQGFGILRRAAGEIYVGLDYGHSGGGHGHPDRLNLELVHGTTRWLDDPGTGSYVDPTLHWYRSTLAHNAPLVDGHSQARVNGRLLAFDDRGDAGWIDAEVLGIAPDVGVRRTVVAMADYVLDVLTWDAGGAIQLDLPIHLDVPPAAGVRWAAAPLAGGTGLEDGFGFVTDTTVAAREANDVAQLRGDRDGRAIAAWVTCAGAHELFHATGPGAPGRSPAGFHLVRAHARSGMIRTVFDWSAAVRAVRFADETVIVERTDGGVDEHARHGDLWRVTRSGASATPVIIDLGGLRERDVIPLAATPRRPAGAPGQSRRRRRLVVPIVADTRPDDRRSGLLLTLGEKHYRRSELEWKDAGAPTAQVRLLATGGTLLVDVDVRKAGPTVFAPARDRNELDNELPDINSDGVQIHLAPAHAGSPAMSWLLVPERVGDRVRITRSDGAPVIAAAWHATSSGYVLRCDIPLDVAMRREGFDLDVIVNEMSPDRERRRGQLVLSGSEREWIYLRGDRQARESLVPFVIGDRGS